MSDHISEIPYVGTFVSEQLQFMRDHILEIPYVRTFKSEQLQPIIVQSFTMYTSSVSG